MSLLSFSRSSLKDHHCYSLSFKGKKSDHKNEKFITSMLSFQGHINSDRLSLASQFDYSTEVKLRKKDQEKILAFFQQKNFLSALELKLLNGASLVITPVFPKNNLKCKNNFSYFSVFISSEKGKFHSLLSFSKRNELSSLFLASLPSSEKEVLGF